jgi:hypothetical protein
MPEKVHPAATQFQRRRQFVKLFAVGFTRFLTTAALIAGLDGTIQMYKGRSIIGEQGRRMFNTLVTGLSMALGITVASSFKNVALDIRLWILSRKKRSIEEASSLVKRTRELITKSEAERRAGQRALQPLTSLPELPQAL